MRPHPANRFSKFSPCGFIPAKTPLARPLMVRQPYCAAVQSDRRSGYIPCPLRGKVVQMSAMKVRFHIAECSQPSPWEKGLGESGGPSPKVKGGLVGFRRSLKVKGGLVGFRRSLKVQEITFIFSNVKKVLLGFRKTSLALREVFWKLFLSPNS